MRNTLRSKNGISLVILVITLVILAILTIAGVTITKQSLNDSKVYSFITELEVIEKKMSVVNKEISLGSDAYEDIGTKYEDLDSAKQQKIQKILYQSGISDYSKYIYLSAENGDLLKLGLKNIDQDVIISYDNSVVYSYDGLYLNGRIYFSIEEVRAVQNAEEF